MPYTSPSPDLHTTNLSSLAEGAQLFLWSARQWSHAARHKQCITRALYPRYVDHNCVPAIPVFDECLSILALAAFRPVHLNCPHAETVSSDEYELALILQSVQRGNHADAIDRAATLLAGRFSTTFIRVVREYVRLLTDSALSFSGIRALALVH